MRIFQLIRFPKRYQLEWYQENCRIYLDEFPEIEECDLRVNFDTSLLMKRFLNKG